MSGKMTLDEMIAKEEGLKKELEILSEQIVAKVAEPLFKHIKKHGKTSEEKLKSNSSCWAGRLVDKKITDKALELLYRSRKIGMSIKDDEITYHPKDT